MKRNIAYQAARNPVIGAAHMTPRWGPRTYLNAHEQHKDLNCPPAKPALLEYSSKSLEAGFHKGGQMLRWQLHV